jgi:hypothetical protein
MNSEADLKARKARLADNQKRDGVGPSWTSPLWIDSLLDTQHLWITGFNSAVRHNVPVVVLHTLIFSDEYEVFRDRDDSCGVISVTVAEVHHGTRGNLHSPAIAPVVIFDRSMRKEIGYDGFAGFLAKDYDTVVLRMYGSMRA